MQVVGFNPQLSFKANTDNKAEAKAQINTTTAPLENDSYKAEKPKKTFKGVMGSIAKFFVNLKEMAVGVFKGVLYGGLSAGAIILGDRTINLKHTLKGKMAAGIIGTGIAAYHIIKARLKSNQRTANVDHQLHLGHRDK